MKYYTEDHVWVELIGEEATIGLTEHLADQLGTILAVKLPYEEDDVIVGDCLGELKTEGASREILSPISGTVSQVNEVLADEPELITESPEDKGWLFRLVNIDHSELDDMMDAESYRKHLIRIRR